MPIYSVWLAYGEPVIVADTEPVWEEPGKRASLVATLEADDFDTACRLYAECEAKLKDALIATMEAQENSNGI